MSRIPLVFSVAILLTLASSHTQASAPFSKMVVFGDSLSDMGNAVQLIHETYKFTKRVNLPAPFYANRASDGPVTVKVLSRLVARESLEGFHTHGGTNFAVLGARASGNKDKLDTELAAQTRRFRDSLGSLGTPAPADALYTILIGGNDVISARNQPADDANAAIANALNAIKINIQRLLNIGANTFLIINLPNISTMPKIIAESQTDAGVVARVNQLTMDFNAGLAALVSDIRSAGAGTFIEFDFYDYSSRLTAGIPGEHFEYTKIGCVKHYKPSEIMLFPWRLRCVEQCGDHAKRLDRFLYFDEQHFTARAHGLIGQEIFGEMFTLTPMF